MTSGSTTVSAPAPARLRDFWRWWTGELRALVPARVTSWVVGELAVTDVAVAAGGIRVFSDEGGPRRMRATVPLAEVATDPVMRELRSSGADHVRLLLSVDQVLIRTLSLPAAIEENLREVMGFELDRHTPFTASQVYYDVKVLRRDSARESIDVLLAVASRSIVNGLLTTLRQAGLSVDAISLEDANFAAHAIELLPAGEKPARKWGNLLRLNLALLALAVALALLALLLPIWQKREEVITFNPLVAKSAAEFQLSQRVNDEYTKLAGEYNYITGKKQGMYTSMAILEELTRISPDTTSLQAFELKTNPKARELTLTGEALAASKVIEVLEQSPMFQNASQKLATRRGSQGTNEWFNVATEIKAKPLPVAAATEEKPAEVPVPPPPVANVPTATVVPSTAVVPAANVGPAPGASTPAATPPGAAPAAPVAVPAQPAVTLPPALVPAPGGNPVPGSNPFSPMRGAPGVAGAANFPPAAAPAGQPKTAAEPSNSAPPAPRKTP